MTGALVVPSTRALGRSPLVLGLLLAVCLAACAAALPDARTEDDLEGCAPGSFGVLGPDACTRDSDCARCRDGSACGEALSRATVASRGEACRVEDDGPARACDAGEIGCCQRRCVLLLSPPSFDRDTEDVHDPSRAP